MTAPLICIVTAEGSQGRRLLKQIDENKSKKRSSAAARSYDLPRSGEGLQEETGEGGNKDVSSTRRDEMENDGRP